jgi:hypothetical protein
MDQKITTAMPADLTESDRRLLLPKERGHPRDLKRKVEKDRKDRERDWNLLPRWKVFHRLRTRVRFGMTVQSKKQAGT